MGRMKDDERRLRAAIASDEPMGLICRRLKMSDSRWRYLIRKIGVPRAHRELPIVKPGLAVIEVKPVPAEETTEPTEEQDGELQGQEWPVVDDQAGCPNGAAGPE